MKRENTVRSKFIAPLTLLLGMLIAGNASAIMFNDWMMGDPNAFLPQLFSKHGAVYTRQIVLGPNNLPQYVGYDETGKEAAYYGEVEGGKVISADYYTALLQRLQTLQNQNAGLRVMDKATYAAEQFVTINNETITKPTLAQRTVFVAVLPANKLYTPSTNPLLLESSVDLNYGVLAENIKSLLLNSDGTVNIASPYNIGPRVAYYGDPQAAQGDGLFDQAGGVRKRDATIFGPIRGAQIEVGYAGLGFTDHEGKYRVAYYMPACPGFTITYNNWIFVPIKYQRFNPKGSPYRFSYLYRQDSDFCVGLGALSMDAANIVNTMAAPIDLPRDFPVDLMVLNGRALMHEGVMVGSGDTVYDSSRADLKRVIQDRYNGYDFDRDGITDKVALGRTFDSTAPSGETIKLFEVMPASANPQTMGIWLSSLHDLTLITANPGDIHGAPDLSRLTDWSPDFEDRALLSQLSADDLVNTDLYVFRESDGSLLIERRGLSEQELIMPKAGVEPGDEVFQYTLRFLSRYHNVVEGASLPTDPDGFMQFQVEEGVLNDALYKKAADHLRPGEQVRIVAINRPTGYIGSVTATIRGVQTDYYGADIDFDAEDIILAPPNLKVWAERAYEVKKGYTASTEQKQNIQHHLIGSEGAGMANDIFINLYTEWLDANNHPLPAALGEYGYTGRMAILTDGNQFKTYGDDYLANFAIKPGRQLQVIQLPESVAANQHFYIHVTGTPHTRDPKFTATQINSGILEFRPDKFVPLKVPLYDEGATDLQLDAWQQARANGQPNLEQPEPLYQWVYRPEFQFTRYDLTVSELRRTDVTGRTEDLYPMEIPVVAGDDQFLDLFYELFAPLQGDGALLQALETYSYNGAQELVFALGEQEILAHVGPNGQITFDNLAEIFASLNAEDLLTLLMEKTITLRLYANNDPSNILWEFGIDPGLSISYRLPHEEHTIPNDPNATEEYPVFRTLGGVRLKLHYDPLEGEYVTGYDWKIELSESSKNIIGASPGWFMDDYTTSIRYMTAKNEQTIYWEPADWTYYGDGDSAFDFEGTLTLTMFDGSTLTKKFRIDRRLLAPNPIVPMQGADVAMLEEMLWQFGISPQGKSPGSEGARIDSTRFGTTKTQPCVSGQEQKRDVYLTYTNPCGPDGKGVSTELMVRRFQARNAAHPNNNNDHHANKLIPVMSGSVDNQMLQDLKRDWVDAYFKAYVEYKGNSDINPTDDAALMDAWISDAVKIWDSGIGSYVPANTYPDATHNDILTLAGVAPSTSNDRNAFLKYWITKESSHHWGGSRKNYQKTPYRMAEGGADEHGSLSFSQLLYGKRYGELPCAAHDNANLNLYHPGDQVKTFVIHTAANASSGVGQTSCKGLMYRGFNTADKTLSKTFATDTKKFYGEAANVNELVGYRHGANAMTAKSAKEDDYDVLAKAVMGYNGGESFAAKYSWAKALKYWKYDPKSDRNGNKICHSCRYTIEVREGVFGAANLRTYIWKGAEAIPDNPATIDVNESQPAWCFAYGEKEWVAGKLWDDVKQAADDVDKEGDAQTPIGRKDCTTGAAVL